MNQQVANESNKEEPLIEAPQAGGVEDNIMGGTPNQIEIDKDFADKVNNAVEDSNKDDAPKEGEAKENSSDDASDQNGEEYQPAKEFMDFVQKSISENYPDHDAKTEANKPENQTEPSERSSDGEQTDTQKEIQELKGLVREMASTMYSDRNAAIDQQKFNSVNDVYLDVVKDTPDYQRTLSDFFNNALLRDHDLGNINRELLEGSQKAVTSELDNYYQARLQAEGYTKQTGLPPSLNQSQGVINPPPGDANRNQNSDPNNRPTSAFDDVDRDFSRKVNNLFSQS